MINSKNQIKFALVSGVTVLLLSCAGTLALYHFTCMNNARLSRIVDEQKQYDKIQTEFYESIIYIATAKKASYKIYVDKVESDMKFNSARMEGIIDEINNIQELNSRLVLFFVFFSVFQLAVIILVMLRYASSVAGRMDLSKKHQDDIPAGGKPVI